MDERRDDLKKLHDCLNFHSIPPFFGRVHKIAKTTISFVISVCPSAWINSAPTGQTLVKFGNGDIFRKFVDKIKVSVKYPKRTMGTLHGDLFYIYDISSNSS